MVSNCFASEQGRDELTNTSALKFCLAYAYVKIAKFLLIINSFFMV